MRSLFWKHSHLAAGSCNHWQQRETPRGPPAAAEPLRGCRAQVRSVRAEIDRREAAGQFVTGRGGAGGAAPMRTPEERAVRSSLIVSVSRSQPPLHFPLRTFAPQKRAQVLSPTAVTTCSGRVPSHRRATAGFCLFRCQAADAEADDGNLDSCMLCGLGGNLLCCDGCPAAYHMRCIGEGAKSIPDGEWLCAECSLGGRGEDCSPMLPWAWARALA